MRNATVPSQLQMVMIIKYIVTEYLTVLSFLDIVINLKTTCLFKKQVIGARS